ncbi:MULTISPECIES: glutathione binding-like protein [Xanthomonas]|uniref:Thiol:disulfide oxidoreductase n=1 Tax=Xanthomonas phaseoli pv. dieffenbachiae TaxID=92828 RepID=A0A1V9HCZ9_9XANT|nr:MULTISPECIES: glutathione binding-like protein [Xanthomonas]MBO9787188.1 glutathione S-transferase N-terminal domain-containing protein [Xanthomonas phaseoli pv. dieffenbachiae]MBO9832991.1 glutathione S-transferase N-terminal domain-containing protein [Xanthomonas phaseoli pv. dieffenbachiae]MBO9838763.1 glutathione S-transferase N-terminal domain-containing protein [Xanthomonas phaseoli pv. dieffenbachiae]MBO9842987.1 glutathione S-transferase N-terminal domain-containing protein [Xanthomo
MIDLYYWPTPNGHKVTLFLEEAGLQYALKPVDIGKGEQFEPAFLQISPNNKMPAIVDHAPADGGGAQSVFESGAILLYLAEKTGRFLPRDARGRIAALEWLFWQMGGLGPMSGQMGHFNVYAPEKIAYAIERYNAEVRRLHGVLDKRLADHAFLAGDDYGIADMASYPWIEVYGDLKPDYAAFPHLKRWHDAIAARPATQRAYALKEQVNPNAGKPLSDEERKHLFGKR